jgi:predicted amidophosphoribosyltransferase
LLDVNAKADNVRGAFTADKTGDREIRHILLVDDVFTTGSTLLACFTALREVFPPSVRISIATLGFVGRR